MPDESMFMWRWSDAPIARSLVGVMGALADRGRNRAAWADPTDRPLVIGGVIAIGVILVGFSIMLGMAALDVWSGLIVFLVLAAVSVPLLRSVARAEDDPWLFKVMYGGLIVKLLSSLVRYFVIFVVYKGNGDAGVYHAAGLTFARRFAAGEPIHPLPLISGFPLESQRIGDITGLVYIITAPSAYAGFFLFSFFCFWGQIMMIRGLKRAVPEANYRRFAVLVLYLPSLLFWPSSIGKEAAMLGCLGFVIYGGALLLAPRPALRGVVYFAVGIVALAFVRPHIAYMSVASLIAAVAVGVISGHGGAVVKGAARGRGVRVVALIALLLLGSFASTRMTERFGGGTGDGDQSALEMTRDQTTQGGSEFRAMAVQTPLQLPAGIVSVLFRPFPWEARSLNSLIAAVEGLVLIGLVVTSWRSLARFPKLALRRPFLVFVGAYVMVFTVAFSYLGNFGILARQRTQMMPMVLALLVLGAAVSNSDDEHDSLRATEGVAGLTGSLGASRADTARQIGTRTEVGAGRWGS